jgi:hypothetical protein
MGSNHMHDHFRRSNPKFNIPTHDPQTGELNPHYEDLTGEKNPLEQPQKLPTKVDTFNEYLKDIANNDKLTINGKIEELKKFIEGVDKKYL